MQGGTESLRQKSILGLSWNVFGNVTANGVSFAVGIALARILQPEDFGLFGMTTILIAVSNSIADSGISIGLIRKSSITPLDYSTAFITNLGFAVFLYLFLFFSAPGVAFFFAEQRLTDIVRVSGIIVLINSFSFVPQAYLTKNISFKPLALASIVAASLSGACAIVLAMSGFSYWSLVWLPLLRQFVLGVFLWIYMKWKPVLKFSIQTFQSLFSFGSKVLASGLISTLQQNIYYVIIGKVFSVTALGFYTRAETMNSLATSNITSIFSKVFFPVLSALQDDAKRLRSAAVRLNCLTFFVSAIIMIFLTAVAEPLIRVLLGEKWTESAWMLQLMCLSTLTMSLNALNRDMLFVKGKSDLVLKFQWFKFLLFVPGVFIAYSFGVKELLLYSLFTSVASFFINSHYSKGVFDYSSSQQLRDIAPYFLVVSVSGLAMWSCLFFVHSNLTAIAIQVLLGFIVLIILCEVLKLPYYLELKGLVKDGIARIAKFSLI